MILHFEFDRPTDESDLAEEVRQVVIRQIEGYREVSMIPWSKNIEGSHFWRHQITQGSIELMFGGESDFVELTLEANSGLIEAGGGRLHIDFDPADRTIRLRGEDAVESISAVKTHLDIIYQISEELKLNIIRQLQDIATNKVVSTTIDSSSARLMLVRLLAAKFS